MITLELSHPETVLLARAIEAYDALLTNALTANGVPVADDRPAVTAAAKLGVALLEAEMAL